MGPTHTPFIVARGCHAQTVTGPGCTVLSTADWVQIQLAKENNIAVLMISIPLSVTYSMYAHWNFILVLNLTFSTFKIIWILNQAHTSRINPTLLWCNVLFVYDWIQLSNVLWRTLASVGILVYSFLVLVLSGLVW